MLILFHQCPPAHHTKVVTIALTAYMLDRRPTEITCLIKFKTSHHAADMLERRKCAKQATKQWNAVPISL
jgi:hypothetical protein